jgi:taurine dioxygenase
MSHVIDVEKLTLKRPASGAHSEAAYRPVANSVERVKITPTGHALGAEVSGVDLSLPVPQDVQALLQQAWGDHLVLLFRGQYLNPFQYRDATHIFGTPQEGANRKYFKAAGIEQDELLPELEINSNLDANGQPTRSNDKLGSLEVVWHSDNSYIEAPPIGSCLYALEVPKTTGDTSFSNQYTAYETLPEDLKKAIAGRRAKHDASRNSAGVLRPGVKLPVTTADVPGPFHPLVIVHPRTRRPALYLGRRRVHPSQFIEGLSDAESTALLDRLWDHATDESLAWTHHWAAGDLLVWDNRCSMHHRTEVDQTQRRVMLRTQFQGEVPVPQ